MNDQINIAIIDDGVNENLYNTGVLKYNIEITPNLMIRERKNMIDINRHMVQSVLL